MNIRTGKWWRGAVAWAAVAWSANAPAANVLQTFYVPLPEDDMQISLNSIDAYRGLIGDVMQSAISMVVGSDGTMMYYDHWEDGYEDDATNPTQTTSRVWGDANPGNGYPPGFPDDVLEAGDVVRLESTIDVTRNSVTIEYDGRDKVLVNYPIAMSRAMYAVEPGEVLAEATGVFDAGTHGTLYRAPVGVDTGTGFGTNSMFSYTAFYVLAEHDYTRIDVDADNDGTYEQTVYLDEGEPYFVNGNVMQGATVKGSQPFQCQLVTGDVGSTYEMRWFELWPEHQWGTDYFTPVGSRTAGGNTYLALVYLFNPNAETITVTYVTATNTGTFDIPPNDVYDVFTMPVGGAARFYTTNGLPFIGVNPFDTSVGGGTLYGYVQHCQTYDWGIGLMPVSMMSTMGVVGWGPGYGTTAAGTNGSPVWVAAETNTTIYVDYDSDPETGSLVDPLGNYYDYSTNVTALQSVRLADMTDEDQTGMRFYTVDGTVLLGAWGEDPEWAQTGNPYLDMGYAIPSFPTIISKKFASLLTDLNTNGYADSGDTIEYFVDVVNVGFAAANNVIFEDDLPTNLTSYVTNTSAMASGGITNGIYDSVPPKLTPFPFDEGGYNVGALAMGATTTIRYVTQVLTNLPSGFDGYIHNNATVGGTNGNWSGGWTVPVRVPGLSIAKTSSSTNLLEPGTNLTYTITVVNTGTVVFTGIQIDDPVPLGVTYVPGSAQIQLSGSQTNVVADRFDERTVTNSNGNIPWLSGWQEFGESDGVAAGGAQIKADVTNGIPLEAYAMMVGNAGRGYGRQADLSGHTNAVLSFNYRRSGLDGGTDYVDVWISSNNWATSNRLVQLAGAATETNRTPTNFNVSAWISTNTGIRFLSSGTMGAADFVWFDNVAFTLAGSNATFLGESPPLIAQNLTLPPGGTITMTYDVTVDQPPVATQVVNVASLRSDQNRDAGSVTNQINAIADLVFQKTSGTTNYLAAGTNLVYTIVVSNRGTLAQTGIHLEDALPLGMTFVSAQLIRPFPHTNEFLDRFDLQAYTNSDGNVAWTGPWTEIADDDSPTAGNVQIAVDGDSIPGQTYALRTATTDGIQREANLAGYTNATLWFDYRRVGLEADDYVNVSVSSNGGSTFTQVGQVGGATNDGSYFSASFNVSAYASTGTVIRFAGSANRTATDYVWLDNVRIAASATSATNALPPPPLLLDGYALPPGTNMTVKVEVQVNDPLEAIEFVNVATLWSDQQIPLASSVTNEAVGTPGLLFTKTSSLAGNWNYGETNTYTITLQNTGTVALTGIRLSDPLPAGTTYVPGSVTATSSNPAGGLVSATNDSTTTFTVPAGITSLTVRAWGGGGGARETGNTTRRSGGGGGAFAESTVTVVPGSTYNVVVGTGGAAADPGQNGGSSYFSLGATTNVLAAGGGGAPADNTAGAAGSAAASIGTTRYSGGAGGLRGTAGGGGGGGSAFTNANGNAGGAGGAALGGTGGTGTGAGGNGGNNGQPGLNGNAPGGGGGGEGEGSAVGGDGAAGRVVVAYDTSGAISGTLGAPPNLWTNGSLSTGAWITITFQATLDFPLAATQFVNTATTTNNQTPPQSASVTNVSVANAVGDFVWFDVDGDGVQDGGEAGLTGVVVRVYDAASNLLAATTSGVAGAYAFTNLPSGSYFLEFVTPTNFLPTAQDQGGDDALDSDISTNTGRTAVFALSGGTNDTTRDAGYYQPPSSIGDFVWNDADGDGVQDGGETGMPDVVVTLYDASSNVVGVTTSSSAGAYAFTNLMASTYFVGYSLPTGFTFAPQDQGGNDAFDSDASPVTGRTAPFYLPPGTADDSRDAGYVAAVYGLTATKTSSAGACLAPGATNTYTIVVQNTGTVAQTGIALEDVLPPGVTYVADSVRATFYNPTGGVVTLTNNASTTFTVPAGITSATVQAWGGGGGGATRTSNGGGGGGGGGAYSRAAVAVLPGSNYVVNVGASGAANTAGGDSWFSLGSTTGVLARGGSGGVNNSATGAAGGSAATGIGDTLYAGGNGANGSGTSYGGGGGSSAGTGAAGNNAANQTGAAAPAGGGAGGNGRSGTQGNGTAGNAPGGGGGGGLRTGSGTRTGGAGAAGRIVLSYDTSQATSGALGAPPNLWTGGVLDTGATVTITFQATVDSPSAVTQILNTASAYSSVQPATQSSVTNCVQYADVGVTKFVTETEPDQTAIIDYWVVATNNGPDTATGLELTDVLPADVQYNSHSNGTYNPVSGIWSVGSLAVGASTTLYFNVTVYEGTGGKRITNSAAVTARDLYDPVPSNDVSAVVIVPKGGATVGDRVWFDVNGDGIQDSGETNGIPDVPVALMNTNGMVVTSMVTTAEGAYLFANIVPGTYYIRFDLSGLDTNYTALSPALQGGDTALDSDAVNGGVGGYAWTTNFVLAGAQTNLTLDLGLGPLGSTRAELAEVWGEWRGEAGQVAWRTSSEFDTAGFCVYRVDPDTGEETRLNAELVPSALQEDGAEYTLADPAAVAGGRGLYRLEEAELTGGTVDHGTHEIQFVPPPPAPRTARAAKAAPRDVAPKKLAGPSPVLKVLFKQEGLYGVSLQAIADGMGLAREDVQALAEENGLAFTEQGAPVPVIYDTANGRMVFHGKPTDNWYARDNAVLIEAGEGLPMARREPGAAAGGTVFPVQVRFEEDQGIGNATMTELPEDWYYWKMVTASVNPALNRVDFPFVLNGYAGGPVTLTADLLGWTRTDRTPDHRAEFFVNGVALGALEFDDQKAATATLTIPEGVAMAGANTLTVRGALPAAGLYSYFVVDGFTAAYNRRLDPGAGTVHFRTDGAGVSAAAFAAPLAVALDDDGVPAWIADESGALSDKTWAAANGERFALVETAELPLLAPEAAAADAWFLAADNRIDYLVVASRALAETAQELSDYRAGQGLRSGVAVFEDVCDLLTGGLRTPEAIPELLAYAQTTWTEAPWMVVLAGNGHYDYLGVKSNEVNHLPPLLLATMEGLFAADGLFADADGDALPDVALGRLPARNAADLAAMIAKIKAFETEFGADWQNQLVLATDTADDAAGSFMKVNDRIAALKDTAHPLAARINLDTTAIAAARMSLSNWFKAGVGFVHFTGHGGAKNWSAKNLLKDTDVHVMANARKPVAVALTCLAGRFEMPGVDNLGEVLLQRATGGAVAAWSPSGLSRNAPAGDLGVAFYRAVLQEGCGRLGLAILQARRAVQTEFISRDTLAVYNLLGDPALKIAGNTDRQALVLTVNSQPPEGGTAGGGGVYPSGARATLTATTSNHWDFAGWSDGVTRNPRTVTVTHGGMAYTALFQRQLAQVSVAADPPEGGTVAGGGTCGVGELVKLTAEAASNWEFTGWTDGELANPRMIMVPAGGRTYTATFRRLTAVVEVTADPAAGGTVAGGGTYDQGTQVRISAAPNPGWAFTGWSDGSLENPRTIRVPADGAAYSARFHSYSADRDAALNAPGLTWTTGGSAPWFSQSHTTYDGVEALQSGAIGHGQRSWLETTMTGPGWISFWWKASSQPNQDVLRLWINGAPKAAISGESGWQWKSWRIPGAATLRWEYAKDRRGAKGADAGWLDQVLWWPRGPFGQLHDFDGDGLADFSRYGLKFRFWFQSRSSLGLRALRFGTSLTLPAVADYDGDGMTDLAVFQPSSGNWHIRPSAGGKDRVVKLGPAAAACPVPGDYDGDGIGDPAVYHRANSRWQVRPSGGGAEWHVAFGLPGMVPVPADYDGDGRTDLAMHATAGGRWHILRSSDGQPVQKTLGGGAALPVPADYDGDGQADLAVFARKTATWTIANSTGGNRTARFGTQEKNPVPVPADYDGDGKADLAVFFPGSGKWLVLKSTNGAIIQRNGGIGTPTLPQAQILYCLRLL